MARLGHEAVLSHYGSDRYGDRVILLLQGL